jgi:FAD/FMN-containing dehydrogenase
MMRAMNGEWLTWAREVGVDHRVPEAGQRFEARLSAEPTQPELSAALKDDAGIDFGKLARQDPEVVVSPKSEAELSEILGDLHERGAPAAVRGTGHTSGGQCLRAGGVVLDLRQMSRIKADDAEAERITLEGGASWRDALDHLTPAGRRLPVVTSNSRTTVGGVLSLGGFGDASHVFGLVAENTERIRVVRPDGRVQTLEASDDDFGLVLCGISQLGVISEATVKTRCAPCTAQARVVEWESLAAYVADASALVGDASLDFLRARVWLKEPGRPSRVRGAVGSFSEESVALEDGRWSALAHGTLGGLERVPLYGDDDDPLPRLWTLPCPALEVVLPLPDGLAVAEEVLDALAERGLASAMPLGASVQVLRGHSPLPLAPLPRAERVLLLALRPSVPPVALGEVVALFEEVARWVSDEGARSYGMSVVRPDEAMWRQQLGDALFERWRAAKDALDPERRFGAELL